MRGIVGRVVRGVVDEGAVVGLDGGLASDVVGILKGGLTMMGAGQVVLDFGDVGEGGFAGVHFIINYYSE